ncbi:triose-phosphate isomerase [Cuniculiplasma sp. SKW4]|uniref:triose-phosphate isomerase n=1 Tax=Cuniculiplasma sp. SKW4 TaxID=3400171 RepID=UPI003FD0B37E
MGITMFEIIVNFKTYREGYGKKGRELLERLSTLSRENYEIYYALSFTDLYLSKEFNGVIAQHVDPYSSGAHTGSIIMEQLIELGIRASLLNHSEKRVDRKIIMETLKLSESMDFRIFVCSESLEETKFLCENGARYVAYEPRELIGGDISVSTSKPDIIRESHDICKSYGAKLLVGAGVKNSQDVSISKSLGAEGILISSGIVKSKKPEDSLNSLMI